MSTVDFSDILMVLKNTGLKMHSFSAKESTVVS